MNLEGEVEELRQELREAATKANMLERDLVDAKELVATLAEGQRPAKEAAAVARAREETLKDEVRDEAGRTDALRSEFA